MSIFRRMWVADAAPLNQVTAAAAASLLSCVSSRGFQQRWDLSRLRPGARLLRSGLRAAGVDSPLSPHGLGPQKARWLF